MTPLNLGRLLRLTAVIDTRVSEDLVDANGHMSLPHYVTAGVRAVWARANPLGLTDARQQDMSLFVSEQHGRYLSEMLLDDRYTAHPAFLNRSRRALHAATYIVDRTHERLACRIESVSIFVSTQSRRSVDFPPALASELDAAIRHDSGLIDDPTLCKGLWRGAPPGLEALTRNTAAKTDNSVR